MSAMPAARKPRTSPSTLLWIGVILAVVLGFFLFAEHRAHLFGFLPYALLLLCPLMHLFMHGGHGGHDHGGKPRASDTGAGS